MKNFFRHYHFRDPNTFACIEGFLYTKKLSTKNLQTRKGLFLYILYTKVT